MSNEHQHGKDRLSVEITGLESQLFGRPRPGRVAEHRLWSYASGALSIEEEDEVQSLMAGDARAQALLEQISQCLESEACDHFIRSPASALAPEPSLARRIWEAAEDALKGVLGAVSLRPEEILAVFLQKPEGLAVRVLLGTEVALKPAFLSPGVAASESEAVHSHRRQIRLPNGTQVSAVAEPEGGFRLTVTLCGGTQEGLVGLKQLVHRDGHQLEEETGIQGRLQDGVATLEECPEGVLRIIAPDGPIGIVVIGSE